MELVLADSFPVFLSFKRKCISSINFSLMSTVATLHKTFKKMYHCLFLVGHLSTFIFPWISGVFGIFHLSMLIHLLPYRTSLLFVWWLVLSPFLLLVWKLQLLRLLCAAFWVIHHINFFFTLPFSSVAGWGLFVFCLFGVGLRGFSVLSF